MKELVNRIKEKFSGKDEIYQRNNLVFITIEKKYAIDAVTYLKEYENYKHLVILTAVDWLEENVFQLTYLLNNPELKNDIGVRVNISRIEAVITSAHHLWAAMATYQRELYEMFGISFPGSPGMKEPLMLEGWNGPPPYRRDFDTKKYSEETFFPREGRFSNDPEAYMKGKMYPEDGNV